MQYGVHSDAETTLCRAEMKERRTMSSVREKSGPESEKSWARRN